MGQDDVLKFLEKQIRPVSCREIAEGTNMTLRQAFKGTADLLEWEDISALEIDYRLAQDKFGIHRRFKLYYIPQVIRKTKKDLLTEIKRMPNINQKVLFQTAAVCEKPKLKSSSHRLSDSILPIVSS